MPLPTTIRLAAALIATVLIAACASQERQTPASGIPPSNNVVVFTPDKPKPATSLGDPIEARAVESILSVPDTRYTINASQERLAALQNPFPPTPKKKRSKSRYIGPGGESDRALRGGRATQSTIESIDTQTNIDNTGGSLFIPADAHGAAGPNHVVAVTNVSIEIFTKSGVLNLSQSLRNFFSAVSPTTATFDPKVIYDQYEDRWLIVTLERSDSPESSSVLLAVSDDSNPNGVWTQVRIDSSINIGGNDHWFDYPGFAVDEQAVYITGNMFRYFDGTPEQGSFGGVRLFVVDKGTSGGFYDGGATSVSVIDPIPAGSFEVTMQPAHTFGNVPGTTGTWLAGWSGLNATGNSAYQILTLDDPLGSPAISADFVFFGTVDNVAGPFPDAPQTGTASGGGNVGIATNDRRVLNAVWREGGLWVAHSFQANSGADSGEVTAGWARVDTTGPAPALDQFGFAGGEDIAAGTFTFFPSLAVNADGGMTLGFSASAPGINVGSYYAYRTPTDPASTLRDSVTIRPGLDYYQRRFSGTDNRWGDYSSAALDPDGACVWIYNKYAINRGSSTGPGDDGRWGTAFAHFCNDAPQASADAADVDNGGTVTTLDSGQDSVLANDSDPDSSDLLVVTSTVSGPDHAASFTLNADGTFSYTHDGTATTSDSVVYEVCDDGSPIECDTATLQFTIAVGINSPPDAVDDAATVAEGSTVATLDGGATSVLANDSDPESGNLSVNGPASPAPMNASGFSLNPNGTFSYTHNGGETLSDSFGYEVCDDGTPVECATATVSITITEVNDPPIAMGETLAEIAEDSSVRTIPFAALLANDNAGPGEAGQTITVTAVSNGAGGSVAINGSAVEFTPTANYNGPAGFDYQITDDGTTSGSPAPLSASATASFTISEVNDPPNAFNDTLPAIDEDSGVRTIPFAELLANDNPGPDEAEQTLTINLVGDPTGGTVAINGTSVDFSPTADFNGPAGFDYRMVDNGTTNGSPDPRTAVASVDFTITAVNDPPVAFGDLFQVDIEQTLNGDVSVNDFDIDSTTLTYAEDAPPATGSLTLNSDGTFEYIPAPGIFGEVTFVYSVSDGALSDSATVTIIVTDIVFMDGFEETP